MTPELRLEFRPVLKVPPPEIILDEPTHQYYVDGVPKRSASEILRPLMPDLSGVPVHHLENAKARGSQIDDACSLLMEGCPFDVVIERVTPEARPYVYAYWEFWPGRNGSMPGLRIQTPLYCAELDFCGMPDWHTPRAVYDNKATAKESRAWGLQLAAYELAHGEAEDSAIVWLRPKLKSHQHEVHTRSDGNRRIFSKWDHDVVRAACQGDYDADCIKRWRDGE